jgi:uncharacterized protein YicC (UPF0701 family)
MIHLKKKFIVPLITVCFIFTGINVYAAALNTNILEIIKNGYAMVQSYFIQSTDNEFNNIQDESEADIQQYINSATDKSISNIQQHMNNEIQRANSEVNAHIDDMKNELETVMASEENNTKKQITNEVNKNIEEVKSTLDKDLEKILKEQLKK